MVGPFLPPYPMWAARFWCSEHRKGRSTVYRSAGWATVQPGCHSCSLWWICWEERSQTWSRDPISEPASGLHLFSWCGLSTTQFFWISRMSWFCEMRYMVILLIITFIEYFICSKPYASTLSHVNFKITLWSRYYSYLLFTDEEICTERLNDLC